MLTFCQNAQLVLENGLKKGNFWLQAGKFTANRDEQSADRVIDFEGHFVAPGFIDLQINGAYGKDFIRDKDALGVIKKKLPEYGVTSFLPTIVSHQQEKYSTLIQGMQIHGEGAEVLGVHLEGPFLNKDYAGAHRHTFLRHPKDYHSAKSFYGSLDGVKLVTLAPELQGADRFIKELSEIGIVVSAGHSGASDVQMTESGIQMGTHLFNRMTPFTHTKPGIVGAILTKGLFYSIIVDGIHVHPAAVQMAWRANPHGMMIVSDGMAAMGMTDGEYDLGEERVAVKDRIAKIKGTDTLAGSNIPLDEAMRNFKRFTNCTLAEAIGTVTHKPAKALGLFPKKGSLKAGSDADFVVLDQNLHVLQTYVGGTCLWKKLI